MKSNCKLGMKFIGQVGRLLTLQSHMLVIAAVGEAQTVPSPEEIIRNPFNKMSAHHRPIGRDAIAGVPCGTGDPFASNPTYLCDRSYGVNSRGRLDVVGTFRIGIEEKPVHLVETGDPFRTITRTPGTQGTGLPYELRFPPVPNLPTSGDATVGFYPHNGENKDLLDVFFQFRFPGFTATRRSTYPILGLDYRVNTKSPRGPGASGVLYPSGVLQGDEINSSSPAPIHHALNATATRHSDAGASRLLHVLNRRMVWPATSVDTYKISPAESQTNYDNQGDLPYGTLIFIRPQDYSKRDSLGLTARQKVIFDVLAFYGVRLVDGQGAHKDSKAVLQLRTDGKLNAAAKDEVNEVLQKTLSLLYPLKNPRPHNRETEITNGLPYAGGGGPLSSTKSVNNAWDR